MESRVLYTPKGHRMPRGGKRTPGPGKEMGRPRQHPDDAPRPRRTKALQISLYPDEIDTLANILQANGDMERSEFVRRSIRHAWLLALSDAQLEALRSLVNLSDAQLGALRALASERGEV